MESFVVIGLGRFGMTLANEAIMHILGARDPGH